MVSTHSLHCCIQWSCARCLGISWKSDGKYVSMLMFWMMLLDFPFWQEAILLFSWGQLASGEHWVLCNYSSDIHWMSNKCTTRNCYLGLVLPSHPILGLFPHLNCSGSLDLEQCSCYFIWGTLFFSVVTATFPNYMKT